VVTFDCQTVEGPKQDFREKAEKKRNNRSLERWWFCESV